MPDLNSAFQPDLTVSIISSNNVDLLLPCLRSLFDSTHHISLEVFVVDNASTKPLKDIIASEFPQVNVMRNEQRLGFSSNNNMVLERGSGRYLMLLNDDTLVLDGAIDALVKYADAHPEAAVCGSSLLNPDLSIQQSHAKFPNPFTEAFVSASYLTSVSKHGAPLNPVKTDVVSGACFLVRREILNSVGMLDSAFDPIYSEEFDWCYRIKKAGNEIHLVPSAKVIHYGSYTMNQSMLRKIDLLYGHKAFFFRKNYGIFAYWVYKFSLLTASLIKAVIFSVTPSRSARSKATIHWYLVKKSLTF